MLLEISQDQITELREHNYHRIPNLRLKSIEHARQFVSDVGFCHFWPIKNIETPNLFHAIAGRVRAVPNEHNDPDINKCWGWKDHALDKRWWYYGKLLRKRATLISLDLLPTFYAGSENYGDIHDYLDEYHDGTLTAEAKDIYEALLEHGPLDTIRLRRESRMSAKSAKSRFDRALVELQVGLKVLPVGVAETGSWRYAFIYEIFQRHFPEIPERARLISRSEVQQQLIQTYLNNVICTDRQMINKVFHVMKWSTSELNKALDNLLQSKLITKIIIKGSSKKQLATSSFLHQM